MDARQKKVLTVLCIGSAFLAWRTYGLVTERLLPSMTQAKTPAPSGGDSAYGQVGTIPGGGDRLSSSSRDALLAKQAESSDQSWGRDPFNSAFYPRPQGGLPAIGAIAQDKGAATPPAVNFSGVSESSGRWLAVVRGKIVRVGDSIDGRFTVAEITKQSITLTAEGWSYRYDLGKDQADIRPLKGNP